MSYVSLLNLIGYNPSILNEGKVRLNNVKVLEKAFKKSSLITFTKNDFPCFYTIKVANRDLLKEKLINHNVYLSSYWGNPRHLKSPLYKNLLCIPVDSRYTAFDLKKIANLIKSKIG